jgi:hypothetical protein
MHRPNEQDLAWDLIDHYRQCLSVAELNTVFLQLGNGQYRPVIETTLQAVTRCGVVLSPQYADVLTVWVAGYGEHRRYRGLQQLVSRSSADSSPSADNQSE